MIGNIKMSNEGFYQIYLIENNMCISNQKRKLMCCKDQDKTFISTFLIDPWNILIHPQYPTALHTLIEGSNSKFPTSESKIKGLRLILLHTTFLTSQDNYRILKNIKNN